MIPTLVTTPMLEVFVEFGLQKAIQIRKRLLQFVYLDRLSNSFGINGLKDGVDVGAEFVLFEVFIHLVNLFDSKNVLEIEFERTVPIFVECRRGETFFGHFFEPLYG